MLVNFSLIIFVIFGVQRGLSLQCYSCLSEEPRDACVKLDKHKIPLETCGIKELEKTEQYAKQIDHEMGKLYEVHAAQEPMFPLNCLKQIIQYGGKHYTLRGCQLATSNNLDICVKVKNENNEILRTTYCSLCNGDACNTSVIKNPNFFLLIIILLIFIIYY